MGRELAMRYRREILEQGGVKDGEDMVTAFLGRPYDPNAYKSWVNANIDRYD